MKVKDPTESCGGMTKEHSYIGHFKNPEHLNRGHNTDPMGFKQKEAYKEATGGSIDDSEVKEQRGPSGYQGVTTGPKGPGSSKSGFISEQIKKGKDETTAKRMADQIFGKD